MKKYAIIMIIGAVILGMAMTASAEDVIEHDASNGERGLDIVNEEDNPDETFILANEEKNDNPVETPVVLGFAGLGAIVLLGISLIVLKRKK